MIYISITGTERLISMGIDSFVTSMTPISQSFHFVSVVICFYFICLINSTSAIMDTSVLTPLFVDLCRICLFETKDAVYLFSDQEESKEILSKIFICFHINISFEKYLPKFICRNCIKELDMANSFRLKCVTFEEKFADYCKQSRFRIKSDSDINPIKQDMNTEEVQRDFPDDSNLHDTLSETGSLNPESDHTTTHVSEKNLAILLENYDTFKCGICNKVLRTKQSLAKHYVCMHQKRKHVGRVSGCGSTRRYNCTRCDYSTPHSQTLVNHMHRHDGVRPYQCECGKSFTQASSLSAHRKTHSNTKSYTCSICGKQFKHTFSLKKHLLVHESGNYSCDICHKTLKTKQSLQNHIYRHYNVRNYSCEGCGDTFVTASELQNHRLKHSSEKKVECHLCGFKTNTKRNLIVHLKR